MREKASMQKKSFITNLIKTYLELDFQNALDKLERIEQTKINLNLMQGFFVLLDQNKDGKISG
jgi:hypothetical protein